VALGFVLFAALFFTLSRSKLVTYLLPVFPPLAWIAAEAWVDPRGARRGAWSTAVVYAVLGGAAWLASRTATVPGSPELAAEVRRAGPLLAAAFAGAGLVAVLAAATRRTWVAFVAGLGFVPLIAIAAGRPLRGYAAAQSGAPLAGALASRAPDGKVRYERCYSPGTDFVLARVSEILDPGGRVTTSNYQLRYRARLIERGEWTVRSSPPEPDDAAVIVRPARDAPPGAGGPGKELHRDARFVAYGVTPSSP
jgi:4-amino-4-deoxy-L-arabinose transferase-like glycosyltransferase